MTPMKLALLSLSRHQFATVISIVAIGLSVACGGILLRLYKLSESRFSTIAQGGDAIVGAKAGGIEILLSSLNGEGKYPDFIPYKLFESLRSAQAVTHGDGAVTHPNYIQWIIPFVYFGKFKSYRIAGTSDDFFRRKRPEESLTLAEGHWSNQLGQVVVGSLAAKNEHVKVGDIIKAQTWTGDDAFPAKLELRVSGILQATGAQWDRTLFSSVEQAHQVFEENLPSLAGHSIWGPQVLHYFLVYLNPSGFSSLEALVNRRTVAQVIQIEEQKERLREFSGAGKNVGFLVTAFVILLGGLSVCSMFVARFEGMSLQLAVLRALGYTKQELSLWLLWEGLLLGVIGVLLGLMIDLITLPILRSLIGTALPPPDLVSSSILSSAIIWIIAIFATVSSVIIPMVRMSRQDIQSSLRGM
jgi:putative ABC transport system permease protein